MRRAIVSMGTLLLLCAVSQAKEPATQPGEWANAIDATDVAAIKKTVGSNVLVKGKVVRAQWSVSGKVMRAEFGNKPDELVLIIFSSKKDDMDKAFGGDVAKAMEGAEVLAGGDVKEYHGHAEIVLNKPAQLKIVKAATTKPAEKSEDKNAADGE